MIQGRALLRAAATLTLVAAGAAPLRAQGIFAAAQGGYFDMSGAKRSLEAVVGSSGFTTFGIETGYGFRRGLYASIGASFSPEKQGERVFLAGPSSPPFKLGFPLTLKTNVLYLDVGWRFLLKKRLVPYVAIGGELVSFRESSDVAGEIIAQDQNKGGFRALAGVEFKITGPLRFGVEGVYSVVPNSIGVGGVSEIYGEDDIGGFTVLGKLIFEFARRSPTPTTN